MINLLAVAVGGAVGSALRYLLAAWGHRLGETLPYGTLTANLLGCFLIGWLTVAFTEGKPVSEPVRLGMLIGVLGGFTTFSSYAWQSLSLMEEGAIGRALLYMGLSNAAGLGLAFLGMRVGQSVQG
ncbi:MAG: fluoride efflux transporter CrcB [Planctomycetota bacterium]